MKIGFILTKTPSEEGFKTFTEIIKVYLGKEELNVFLIGNGVYCAMKGHKNSHIIHEIMEKGHVYVLINDLQARGITEEKLFAEVKTFSGYETMVKAVMEDMDQVLSF